MLKYSIIGFFLFLLIIPLLFNKFAESFQPDILAINQKYSQVEDEVLLQDDYPVTKNMGVTKNSASTIWWNYPIFKVGSYAQITNNLKYPNNPDNGQCMPAEFCGALYENKPNMPTNFVNPLDPVPNCPGARINYYTTQSNLLEFK
jgi:hypothetical protein